MKISRGIGFDGQFYYYSVTVYVDGKALKSSYTRHRATPLEVPEKLLWERLLTEITSSMHQDLQTMMESIYE